jgi:uncharacterized radical SAM superfamily protein
MGFLEKVDVNKNNKRMVCSRISEDIVSALDAAKDELKSMPKGEALCGYTFSMNKIIEKSFKDTLKEIKEKTGLDFYELEKFKLNLKDLCDRLQQEIDIDMFIDESIDSIKEKYDKLKYTDDENISMHIIIENAYKEIEGRWISESLK